MKIVKFLIYYLLGVLGIIAVSNAPILLSGQSFLDFPSYITNTGSLIKDLFQLDKWTYNMLQGREINIITFLMDPYLYSMKLLTGAFLLGLVVALVLAIVTMFLPKKMINTVKRGLGLIEAVPDLMVAFLFQLLVVYIFRQTDVLLMKFVTLGDQKLYLAPIVVLSFLPMISFYRLIVLLIEEELTKDYVEFALSKGAWYNAIIFGHVLRNIVKSVFFHSKIIMWALLSSLFVIEYLFNINGISSFIIQDFRPLVIAIVLLMLFTPLFIIYQGVEMFVFKQTYYSELVRPKKKKGKINWPNWPGLPKMPKIEVLSWLERGMKEFAVHLKNPKFLFGFVVITSMVTYSFIHSLIREVPVEQFVLIYDDEGNLLSSKPHPPSEYVVLGTDRLGYSILDQLLTGAKYTILFAGVIAFLRMAIGFLLAVPYALFIKERWRKGIEKIIDSMHFLPLTIIAIVILRPVLMGSTSGFNYSFTERMLIQAIILTLLVVPLVTVLIGGEIKLLMEREFIASAKVLGGNTKHVVWRHLMPHLGSKLGIIFGQQFIQVLLVLIHLGLFNLFLGGTSVMYNAVYRAPEHSVTFEWSGLISSTREAMMTGHHWIIVPVFIAFIIVIISMQLIVEGIQDVQQERVGVHVRKSKWLTKLLKRGTTKQEETTPSSTIQTTSFTFVKTKDQLKK
ncbi:ABC transporter permease subunit [Aquibacillus halophilus]|uniref:ABC transporter permease subunit n=1 Tax=Aquibacillus halophilus TaxID=930132 RepID=A0A6A8DJR0_9BACI|nr:ABC transporter permease subunit [Aquibacillus halophilus]MRH44001.1 ABC transporter permease subunit [Aquibacillus halophilus]